LPKAEEFIEASSKQELRSYLESPKIDDLDCEALEKEAADKSFLSQEKLKNLLADEREDAQIRLAASWLLEQWGEEMPMRMAEVDGEGKIRLRVIEEKLPTTVVEDLGNGISLELVEIPGGEFWMVSPEGEEEADPDERRRHKVKVSPFLMGKYPITQAQWKAIAERTDLKVQLDLQLQPSYFQGDDRPVESVSWHDAVEFCKRLSASTGRYYRLPSEAEWEYACRAISGSPLFEGGVRGGATPFYFGETLTGKLANYNASYTYADEPKGEHREQTTPVGSFSPNAFGLYDMHGNVWEWCADHWHESYKGAPNDGSAWLSENENNYRMLRGGSWNGNPNYCRSASRDWVIPDVRNYVIGLRVVAPSRT
jgi:formylglycine-generating enzyme required for sulfatase activity